MTSFFLPPEQKATLNQLIRQYPTVSVIELDVVIREIQGIIGRVGQAIELVLLVILLAGSLVLVAGVQASVDVRLRESALLRALGARSTRLVGALWIEFTTLGCLAGLLAVVGAEAAAWLLQTQALDLAYQPNPILWPAGVLVGGLTVGILGVLACRRAVQAPPLTVLRDL
jgi:putative ABC transport system permease protein